MTYKTLSFSLIILLVLASTALLYTYFERHFSQPKYPVIIAVSKTPLSTPFYVAQSIGAFDSTCVDIEFDEVVGGQRAFEKVINGQVDFGTSSDSVIAYKSLEERSFVTHAMFVQSDNDVKLITRRSANLGTAADLKNRNVGITKNTSSEYFLSTLLALEGLTTQDVVLHHYKPEELINGFISKDIDAFVPWEPFGFYSNQLHKGQVNIHDTKSLHTLSFNLISSSANNLLVKKAKCVIEGLSIAIDYIASNPEDSKLIVMNKLNLTSEFIDWVWPDYIFKLGLDQSLVLNIESQARWAIETRLSTSDEMPDIERFIDTRALLQVTPNAVHIRK